VFSPVFAVASPVDVTSASCSNSTAVW
jgi:hypothetical protein